MIYGPTSKTSTSEMVKDSVAVVDSFRTIASLMVTSPAFRQLGSDVILLSRDILADGAELVADQAASAADATRPSENERKEGVDYGKLKEKGKAHAKHTVSGLYQAQAKEAAFDKAVDTVKVCRRPALRSRPSSRAHPPLSPYHSTLTKNSPPRMKPKTSSSPGSNKSSSKHKRTSRTTKPSTPSSILSRNTHTRRKMRWMRRWRRAMSAMRMKKSSRRVGI
ncbi:hypothetical protein QFC24_001480 [Naganishia onofrii]|uniref:Uncharacterized protein n=1 Tax=Naganishia onofrii TaxID=1851511 RepID=A0ACC2XVF5_9TREE|nr:hypothetical protein QFC24_001480 [Naganishia onofrii]